MIDVHVYASWISDETLGQIYFKSVSRWRESSLVSCAFVVMSDDLIKRCFYFIVFSGRVVRTITRRVASEIIRYDTTSESESWTKTKKIKNIYIRVIMFATKITRSLTIDFFVLLFVQWKIEYMYRTAKFNYTKITFSGNPKSGNQPSTTFLIKIKFKSKS